MKKAYGFIEFENIDEFRTWLKKQKVYRRVTRLQVHHMWLPDYSCWSKDNALRRQKNTKDFHIHTNHWDDIAQHFSIYPNGHIVTGRSLNKTPIGIRGWNTNAICVEIYGNFDKGHDKMTAKQKEAVIGLYGELCKKFDIPVNSTHIRPHAGLQLVVHIYDHLVLQEVLKLVPGTNFMGIGNTRKAFVKFYKMIKDYMNGKKEEPKDEKFKPYIAKPTTDDLNCRKGAGTEYDIECTINKDVAVTIIGEVEAKDGGIWLHCKAGYYVNKKYMEFIRYI